MQKCGLCLNDQDLKESHLMPKALYKAIKQFYSDEGKDLVIVNQDEKSAYFSDKQTVKKFLCKQCELLFNKNGENTVLKEYWIKPNSFKLLTILNNAKPVSKRKDEEIFDPLYINNLNEKHYLYFAASIFWRASATKWNNFVGNYYGALGNYYQELFRKYLLGLNAFPKHAFLLVNVNIDDNFNPLSSFPTKSKSEGVFGHNFMIPGIEFELLIGKALENINEKFVSTNILFVKRPLSKSNSFKSLHRLIKNDIKPKGRLAKNRFI